MFRLKNQDEDDEDVDDSEEEEDVFLFVPIMNTPSNIEEELQGFPTLSEALLYDLTEYNFDLVELLKINSQHQQEQEQYKPISKETNANDSADEVVAVDDDEDEDGPKENGHYHRMYGAIQCINFCRQYVKTEKNNDSVNNHIMSNIPDTRTMGKEEENRFDLGKRTSDAYVNFLTKQQNQSCYGDGDTFLFHHPVLENDAYLFHIEDLLELCSNKVK